jgi:serine/threonine protein kinase
MFRRTDFKKLELFGNGKKNTRVFKVKHIKTGKIYVLKEVEAHSLDKLNEYKEEAVQLSKVQNHPNVLQFYGYYFYETPHNTYKLGIISESINRELNLEIIYRKRAKTRQYFSEKELLTMIYSLVDAFAYLESVGICHRDIKPTNLFLLENFQIKVIDFGESKEFVDDDDEEDEHSAMATIRGTPQYLSPILWEAHVISQVKHVEHNMFKSDVFSAGLVIFQIASLKDVNGFNQKTDQCNGERLIYEGLKMLSKKYSNKVIEILSLMLKFDENERPNFVELVKYLAKSNDYVPKPDMTLIQYLEQKNMNKSYKYLQNNNNIKNSSYNNENNNDSNILNNKNNNSSQSSATTNDISDTQKIKIFNQYKIKNKLNNLLTLKNAYWFEYGGNMIARHIISKNDTKSKWRLIAKYKSSFSNHFLTIYAGEAHGFFLIGGTNSNNTLQFINNQIIQKNSMNIERSFMSCLFLNQNNTPTILAIGGYDYSDKGQLSSIESYDINKDIWSMNIYPDLNIGRSQATSLLFNDKKIFVFGGYNKNYGTLNSIEEIDINNKVCNLIEMKLPIPLRRFAAVKISENKVIVMGGITRLCKESDATYILNMDNYNQVKYNNLPKAGTIEHEVFFDEIGDMHLFYENKYGTSPPTHIIYSFLDFNSI